MACASAIERNRLVATTLASASLLPELQTLRTSKSRFQHLPRHGSSYPRFAGTGEPAKRSFSHRTLPQAKVKSLACSRSHAENTPTILLLLGEESCAKSCASLVLRCQRSADNWSRAAASVETGISTFEGFEVQGEVTRSRGLSQPADFARWQTRTP